MKVLVVCGASGGHIFPALAFIDEIKKTNINIETQLILPIKSIKTNIDFSDYNVQFIDIVALSKKLNSKNILAFLKFLKGSYNSLIILLKFKPDVVIGFGSLVSIPVILFAWIFRIRTIIHEQNVIPGKANKFMIKFIDKLAISFKETEKYLIEFKNKIVFTGNPIRKDLVAVDKYKALTFFKLNLSKMTILVMGGSQGSHSLNQSFLDLLLKLDKKLPIQFIHLCGLDEYDFTKDQYKRSGFEFKVFSFLKEMNYAYSCADLVISRAGATTVTELIQFRLPAILIPYPFAYAHQVENAKVLDNQKAAVMIEEKNLNLLENKFSDLISNKQELGKMKIAYENFTMENAAVKLASEVLNDYR